MLAIYPVRPGDHNPELRTSLRSLANLPEVDEVWTIGHRPTWLTPDRHIDGNLHHTPQANVYNNVREGARQAAIDGHAEVIVMNDDFIITAPVHRLPALYRCTLAEHLALPGVARRDPREWWPTSLHATRAVLQAHGIPEPLSYELHAPYRCDPARMADILDQFQHVTPDNPPQWRSLYGNVEHVTAAKHTDGKAYGPCEMTRPYFSTQDDTYRHFAQQLDDMFPTPSRWESL